MFQGGLLALRAIQTAETPVPTDQHGLLGKLLIFKYFIKLSLQLIPTNLPHYHSQPAFYSETFSQV